MCTADTKQPAPAPAAAHPAGRAAGPCRLMQAPTPAHLAAQPRLTAAGHPPCRSCRPMRSEKVMSPNRAPGGSDSTSASRADLTTSMKSSHPAASTSASTRGAPAAVQQSARGPADGAAPHKTIPTPCAPPPTHTHAAGSACLAAHIPAVFLGGCIFVALHTPHTCIHSVYPAQHMPPPHSPMASVGDAASSSPCTPQGPAVAVGSAQGTSYTGLRSSGRDSRVPAAMAYLRVQRAAPAALMCAGDGGGTHPPLPPLPPRDCCVAARLALTVSGPCLSARSADCTPSTSTAPLPRQTGSGS